MLQLESTCPCPPEGAADTTALLMPGFDQKACFSIMNTWVGTLACKILDVIVTQHPADPAKPTPPHTPSLCPDAVTARGGRTLLSEKVMSAHRVIVAPLLFCLGVL